MEIKRDFQESGFENDAQIEGVPGITNNDSKYCCKCNYVDNIGKVKFCPMDGIELKQREKLEDILKTVAEFSSFIYQKEDDKYVIRTDVKTVKPNVYGFAASTYRDGSIDFDSRIGCANLTGILYPKDIQTLDNRMVNSPPNLYGKYIYASGNQTLNDILIGLIHYEITNPICRNTFTFNSNVDCWLKDKTKENDVVILKPIYEQFTYTRYVPITSNTPKSKKLTSEWSDIVSQRTNIQHMTQLLQTTQLTQDSKSSYISQINQFTQNTSNSMITNLLQRMDIVSFEECTDMRDYYRMALKNYGVEFDFNPYNPKLLPEKNFEDSKTDAILKEQLGKIKEDIFYSRRNRRLYILSELIDIFRLEGRIIKNLNFKEKSKYIRILNVNAFTLNEEMDQLFEFVEFRQKINKFNRFELNCSPSLSMLILLGINQ